jgi:tripartite-type tricarboxylate transporter receptor subunit TctC
MTMRMAALAAALGLTALTPAFAFTPSKPVEFVVTAGAGGGTDIFARTIQSSSAPPTSGSCPWWRRSGGAARS